MEAAPTRRSYIDSTVIRSLLMGLRHSVVARQFCRTDRVLRLWIEMFNRGGIDALTTKRRPGRGRKVKLECLRDLLVPVFKNASQAGELHWTGVKVHGWLKEQPGHGVGYSTTVRYLHELRYNLRVLGLGRNARMKKNEMLSWFNCASGKPIPPWSYGLPTSVG